jgi:N-acyl-D-aspartate/D-glutamate deacylase
MQRVATLVAILLALGGQTPSPAGAPAQTLIRNARLIDGSGSPARIADVRIAGDRIVAVGQLSPVADERTYDAGGLALAPGFIDTHSHHDRGSSLSAANAGIVKHGLIAPDYFADLVVFDPSTVADRADFGLAQDLAVGVRTVWVNGQVVFDNGKTTTAYPGRPLRRTE